MVTDTVPLSQGEALVAAAEAVVLPSRARLDQLVLAVVLDDG